MKIERLEREYQKVLDMTTAETHARINNYTVGRSQRLVDVVFNNGLIVVIEHS